MREQPFASTSEEELEGFVLSGVEGEECETRMAPSKCHPQYFKYNLNFIAKIICIFSFIFLPSVVIASDYDIFQYTCPDG